MEDLLQKQGLKRTKLRMALLGYLFNSKHAQSYLDIKNALGEQVDKSTLYRNLGAFEEAGLIHRINDQSGMAKYAFGALHDHGNAHAHFVCESCETVYCIENANSSKINVPEGFKTKNVQTIIKGTCAAC
ncbi:MAG: transcriptional repressor [Allomuricauda sp.]|nr:MAG: transcriptional repressor [Allomuricauda sp.]